MQPARRVSLRVRGALLATATWAMTGCGIIGPVDCTAELGWRVSHTSAVLQVGEGMRVSAEAFTCGGKKDLPVEMRWSSSDEGIVVVGGRDGRAVGVAIGTAQLVGVDEGRYGIGPVHIDVEVVE